MKIEAGKSYINAHGDVTEVLKQYSTVTYPFTCGRYSYTGQGKRIVGRETPNDLICEVVPTLLEQYSCGYISQREFIEKHIKHWTENEQTDL